jgi:hypothetical protein
MTNRVCLLLWLQLPGSGNYWLSILPSDGGAEEAMRMWFLDSIRTPPWWWSLITGWVQGGGLAGVQEGRGGCG